STGTLELWITRSKSASVTLRGRSSSRGRPQLAHLGFALRRSKSTRLSTPHRGQRTVTGRPVGGAEAMLQYIAVLQHASIPAKPPRPGKNRHARGSGPRLACNLARAAGVLVSGWAPDG